MTNSPYRDDAELSARVGRLLSEHPALSGQRITATVQDGVVWLTGTVERTAFARAARRAALVIPGVVAVVDGLELRPRPCALVATSAPERPDFVRRPEGASA